MKRRRFIQAASLLPFVTSSVIGRDTSRNEDTVGINQEMAGGRREFFYRPEGAWAGDFIPFCENGGFHLFYLLDWRDSARHGVGTPWYRVSTRDFVHFTEHGEMLPRGTSDEQDLFVFTGSAIKANGQYHIFYTGHNDTFGRKGKPMQGVMHAVSDDMKKWTKIVEQTFFAPADRYEKDDWRDPFVFWNDQTKQYNMLLCARFKKGIPRRRGLTGLCVSDDLVKWEVKEPFYAPDLYFAHECPDLFRIGDWWYLIFSEFTDLIRTRYRMSRSLQGPWVAPVRDCLDGHAFYAAKTAANGDRRFIFGWNPTRRDSKDSGSWDWGGNLVVHEIIQQGNGELAVRVPETVSNAFSKPMDFSFTSGSGNYSTKDGVLSIDSTGSFGAAVGGTMPDACRIKTTAEFSGDTREFGIMIRCSEDMEKTYYIRLEPPKNRLSFDMWPRVQMTHMAELDREISLKENTPITIQIYIDRTIGVVYVNDEIAMNFRAYDMPEGNWGFYVSEGRADFKDSSMSAL